MKLSMTWELETMADMICVIMFMMNIKLAQYMPLLPHHSSNMLTNSMRR